MFSLNKNADGRMNITSIGTRSLHGHRARIIISASLFPAPFQITRLSGSITERRWILIWIANAVLLSVLFIAAEAPVPLSSHFCVIWFHITSSSSSVPTDESVGK
jgi:hypothetical protein